jgi:hypothetical protein
MKFKEFLSSTGEIILYVGEPNLDLLEKLALGFGDIWHSSFEQGFKNAFLDIKYQTATFFWFTTDFDNVNQCISWRINPNQFAVRKSVWEALGGFDKEYENKILGAFDFGYNALRGQGAVPLYCEGLFTKNEQQIVKISTKDRYTFFVKNFKIDHSLYMIFRKGVWNISEWNAFFYAKRNFNKSTKKEFIKHRELKKIQGKPSVSYIIPTMMRQDYTLNLLHDLANQNYLPSQVVVVDATPIDQRDENLYNPSNFPILV